MTAKRPTKSNVRKMERLGALAKDSCFVRRAVIQNKLRPGNNPMKFRHITNKEAIRHVSDAFRTIDQVITGLSIRPNQKFGDSAIDIDELEEIQSLIDTWLIGAERRLSK